MSGTPRIISLDASGNVRTVEDPRTHQTRERLAHLAWWLDSSIAIPGTRMTLGFDAVLGLFPVIGDLLAALVSCYIISEAARLGAPRAVLARMALNVGIETVLGSVPLAGDLFDAAFKANQRNVRLLDAWLERPVKTTYTSRLLGWALVLALVAVVGSVGAAIALLVRWLVG